MTIKIIICLNIIPALHSLKEKTSKLTVFSWNYPAPSKEGMIENIRIEQGLVVQEIRDKKIK